MDPTHLDTQDTIMEAIGIQVTDISEERVVATMPVHGPTLPWPIYKPSSKGPEPLHTESV